MIKNGEKIHIIERRYFPQDILRHFCGEVIAFEGNLLRVTGYVWVLNAGTNEYIKKPEKRERIFVFGDRLTINIISANTDLEKISYTYKEGTGYLLTDGGDLTLCISEFGVIN